MNIALEEVASTSCNDECGRESCGFDFKDIGKNKIFIFIILIALIACSCGGGGFPGGPGFAPYGRAGKCGSGCGTRGGGSIVGLLVLAFLFAGNGLGGIGPGATGNVNTNVINLGPEDECCDEPCDNCC